MERRYLVAALAVIATFAVTSHGFRELQHLAARAEHSGTMARSHCAASAARALAKISTHLAPRSPEEAQLLAEMNVPIAGIDSSIAQQVAQRNEAVARCASERAMRQAEQVRREAIEMRQQMSLAAERINVPPISVDVNLPADLDQRIQAQVAAMTARIQANSEKMQIAADNWRKSSMHIENMPVVEVTDDGGRVTTHVHVHTDASCKTSRTTPDQRQPE